MTRPSLFAARLPDGRLHLQEGPIDLVIEAFGEAAEVERAYAAAAACFEEVLPGLVAELPVLRQPATDAASGLQGPVARRMAAACLPHRGAFVTPMAAVAGAVADHVLAAMTTAAELTRAYVNDGGDIALHLASGESFACGMVAEVSDPRLNGRAVVTAETPIRGIATSGRATLGQGGRSFSLGIADAMTVFARSASEADVAATLIANAVDLPGHPAVHRQPACDLDPESDLGAREVTVAVGPLSPEEIRAALEKGIAEARRMQAAGLIEAAALFLRSEVEVVDGNNVLLPGSRVSTTLSGCHPGQASLRARAGIHGRGRALGPTMDPRVKPEDDSVVGGRDDSFSRPERRVSLCSARA
jgi:uncharacterized protein